MGKKLIVILYWILSITWAFPTTLLGIFGSIVLILTGNKPKVFCHTWYFPISNNWGLELGPCFISPKNECLKLKFHELGHGLQAAFIFGPFFLIIVGIPSAIRYHLREINEYKNKLIYSICISFLLLLIGIIPHFYGFIKNSNKIIYLGLFIDIIIVYINCWLFLELRKYKNKPYPRYDDAWFEGDATRRGFEFVNKYFKENINYKNIDID